MKAETQESRDYFRNLCAEKGLKVTPQRVTIYQEVLKSNDHPSADTVYKRVRKSLPNISFDTVYRTLISLSDLGLINMVEGYGESRRFEPKTDQHHHHCRCVKCYGIIDFLCQEYNNLKVPRDVEEKFAVTNKKVVLEGYCSNCQKK